MDPLDLTDVAPEVYRVLLVKLRLEIVSREQTIKRLEELISEHESKRELKRFK